MLGQFLKYLLIIYTFFLPLQTRLFLVDSGVEYQRISLYGTQILFALIVILFLILEAKRKSEARRTRFDREARRAKSEITALAGSRPGGTISNIKYPLSRRPFTIHYSLITLLILFVSIQLVSSSRIYLSIQTLLWIAQTMLFIWIVRREKLERMILWTFVVSMCVQSIFIWIQAFTQFIPAFKWLGLAEQVSSVGGVSVVETTYGRYLRGYGIFPHPNIAGGYLLIAILALSKLQITNPKSQTNLNNQSLNIQNKRITSLEFDVLNLNIVWNLVLGVWNFIRLRVMSYVILGLLVSALVFTFSRSAMLGLGIFIIATLCKEIVKFFKFGFKLSTIHYPLITLLFFLVIAIPFRDLLFSRVNTSNRLESKSVVERQVYSAQAKEIIKDNIWFGTGLGNYTVVLQQRHPNRPTYEYQPPHNVILLALSELGVFGLVLVVFVFWFWFRIKCQELSVKKTPTRSPPYQGGDERGGESSFFHLTSSMVFGLLPILLFDHYLWSLYAGWILLGIVALSFGSDFDTIEVEKGGQSNV